jgi:hypothetical protein
MSEILKKPDVVKYIRKFVDSDDIFGYNKAWELFHAQAIKKLKRELAECKKKQKEQSDDMP